MQGWQEQVQQGQAPSTTQENLKTQTTDNAADHGSSFRSDPKANNSTLLTREEIDNSSEKSKTEKDKPSADQAPFSQERLQIKNQDFNVFNVNVTLPAQDTKNSSQEQSKSIIGEFIDLQSRFLQNASEAVSRKKVNHNYNDKVFPEKHPVGNLRK